MRIGSATPNRLGSDMITPPLRAKSSPKAKAASFPTVRFMGIQRCTIHGIAVNALCMKPPSVAVIQVEPSQITPSAAASLGVNDTLESCTWVAAW